MSAMPPIATKNGEPLTRRRANGNNFSNRFPQIVAALGVPLGRRLAAVLELRRINLLERAVRRTPSHLVNELLTKDEARRIAAIFGASDQRDHVFATVTHGVPHDLARPSLRRRGLARPRAGALWAMP